MTTLAAADLDGPLNEPTAIASNDSRSFGVLAVDFTLPRPTLVHVGAYGAMTVDGKPYCSETSIFDTNKLAVGGVDVTTSSSNYPYAAPNGNIMAWTQLPSGNRYSALVVGDSWLPAGLNRITIDYFPLSACNLPPARRR